MERPHDTSNRKIVRLSCFSSSRIAIGFFNCSADKHSTGTYVGATSSSRGLVFSTYYYNRFNEFRFIIPLIFSNSLKNGVPQGSVLAPLLFNLYTSDLPKTQSKKYIYADDIALMISGKTFGPIEQSLSEDLDNMSRYFSNWRLKIKTGKTVCTSFHLAHRLAKYQLQVTCEGQPGPAAPTPQTSTLC